MSDKSQETLLDELLQLETEKERRAYLDRVCQGDGELRQRLTEKTLFTKFSQMIGTPAYISPEQAEMTSLDVDTRTDVYSLGVLLYGLLTGTAPFSLEKLLSLGYHEMQRVILEEEPDKPSTRITKTGSGGRLPLKEGDEAGDGSGVGRLTEAQRMLAGSLRGDLDWITMKAL